jgi:RNA polymerase sigma-70 factor, ECF subfamily
MREALMTGRQAVDARQTGTDDAVLLQQVARGDRDALGVLYRRHARVVLAQIRLVVGEPGLSEEILQDTMLAVWQGAGSFRGGSQVRSWIIAIALRQARDRLRRRRLAVVPDESVLSGQAATDPGPEAQALERAELAAVADAIRSLSPGHREVLGLVFGADLTLAGAAQVLGVPVGTVKSRLAAARAALARSMVEKEVGR